MTSYEEAELVQPCHIIHRMPNEILLYIFGYLEKFDLKQVRLVGQRWAYLPIERLYDRIFISHHSKDLEVLTKITNSPRLSGCVTELVVGSAYFEEIIDSAEYLDYLEEQFLELVWEEPMSEFEDQQFKDLLGYFDGSDPAANYPERRTEISRYPVVQTGLSWYRKAQREQQENISTREFDTRLTLGFRALSKLRTVNFQHEWNIELDEIPSYLENLQTFPYVSPLKPWQRQGSPLARSWHPFCVAPRCHTDDMLPELRAVMHCLTLTGKPLQCLSTSRPASSVFSSCSLQLEYRRLEDILWPLRSLEKFDLNITRDSVRLPLARDLPTVLHSLYNLKHLNINLDDGILDGTSNLFSFSDLLGSTPPSYPHLTELRLIAIACSQPQLLSFLCAQPNLTSLTIGFIRLTEGRWAPVFCELRSLKLQSFVLEQRLEEGPYRRSIYNHQGGGGSIDRYVVEGGQNPLAED